MKAIITNSYYTLNPFMVHWIGRWENGKRMKYSFYAPFRPYFYYLDGNRLIKKEVDIPSDVKEEREKYQQTYESDIVYPERVLIDLGIRKGVEIFDPSSTQIKGNYRPLEYRSVKQPLRKLYIDIETDERKTMNLNDPEGEVLSIAMRDSYRNLTTIYTTIPKEKINTLKLMQLLRNENAEIRESLVRRGLTKLTKYVGNMDLKVVSVKNEEEMLKIYRDYLYSDDAPDIQSGYNINGFDLQYLNSRAEKRYRIKMAYRFHRGTYGDWWASHNQIVNLDLYYAYMRLQENDMKSFSLESVSQKELGIGKIQHSMGYHEMYEKNPELFLIYNYRDTLLCHLLDMKIGIVDTFATLSEKAGTLDLGKWAATYLVDSAILRRTKDMDFKLPKAEAHQKIEVEGGKVMIPSSGVFHNVVVFDFKHLYPNIMVQFNISPDTLLLDDQITGYDIYIGVFAGHRVGYRKDVKGVIPATIVELVEERYRIKAEMKKYPEDTDEYVILNNDQRAVKEVDNSFYGVTGNEHARLFNPYDQASITYVARQNLKFVAEFVIGELTAILIKEINRDVTGEFKVVYGDTDSVFIWNSEWEKMTSEQVIEEAKIVNRIINSQFVELVKRFNADTGNIVLEMEFEKIYSAWEQWGAKKQYAGWIVWKDGKYLEKPKWDIKGFDPRRSDRSIYGSEYFMPKFLKFPLESKVEAIRFYDSEAEKWDNHKIDPEIIGIYFSLNKDGYREGKDGSSSYMQRRAYDNAIKHDIKLDRMKGKFRMYFLTDPKPDDVIALNYDDPVPKWIIKKLDWKYHRERCMDVEVIKNIIKYLRNQIGLESFEVDE
jgi:DNA polymerase I